MLLLKLRQESQNDWKGSMNVQPLHPDPVQRNRAKLSCRLWMRDGDEDLPGR